MMAGLTIANIVGVPLGTFIGQSMGWRYHLQRLLSWESPR